MPDHSYTDSLSNAILSTLAYSDVFDYPLTADEIYRYLAGASAPFDEVVRILKDDGRFMQIGDYFTLPGREEIVSVRMQREARSRKLLPIALRYGRALGSLPFVRMAALTGSLAVMNVSETADFDYLLVTKPGRLWTARAFAVTFGRIIRPLGHTLCVNLLLSENALTWHHHDLYSAREMCQMIPITGLEVYRQLHAANQWAESFLPNAASAAPTSIQVPARERMKRIQYLLELPLRGQVGAQLEQWAMNSQLRRIMQRPGASDETNFSADLCQANFHHHRKWTRDAFEEKLRVIARAKPEAISLHGLEIASSSPPRGSSSQ